MFIISFTPVQHMTDFYHTASLSRPLGTLGLSIFCHRTALRLYGVIEIQPLVYLHREIMSIFAN